MGSGNREDMETAEQQAETLAESWFLWFSVECPEEPPAIRLDFLVSRPHLSDVDLWTVGVQECAVSLHTVQPAALNAATLNSVMRNDVSDRFPIAIPELCAG